MRINNNLMAMNTHRQLGINAQNGSKSIEKLSSGYRINRAGDDAAGLAISEKMRGQIRGLNQASRNSQDAISMIQTAEGALNETQAILQRMRELAVQSANDTNVDTDRDALQNEINQLTSEITRIADTTEFNTQDLLNGSLDDIKFQIGANESQEMQLSIGDMRAGALSIESDVIDGNIGSAIENISADDAFAIDGASLTATAGGEVAAKLESDEATVNMYAEDITLNFSPYTSGTPAGVTLNGDGFVQLTSGSDVPWESINTSGAGTATINISTSGTDMVVQIDVTGSGSSVIDIADAISADADGNYVYNDHGVSFTMTATEFNLMTSGGGQDIDISLDAYPATSGAALNMLSGGGQFSILSNYTNTESGGTYAAFSGNGISLDAAGSGWLANADNIVISGTNFATSGGILTVGIYDSGNNLIASDTYTFSGVDPTFEYDNHGINFKVEMNETTDLGFSGSLGVVPEAVSVSNAGAMGIKITDDNGETATLALNMGEGHYTLQEIADEINSLASGNGNFAADIATVVDGAIVLESAFNGADSSISFSGVGGYGDVFDVADTGTGSDSSINFVLKDAAGDTIDTASGISSTATRVKFTDSDDNSAIFELTGYDSLTGVDVETKFAASDLERTTAGIDISTQENASAAITTINDAIEAVSTERAKLGAVQNRLEHTIKNLDTSAENLQASESRIRDVDMAKEMMEFTKNNILQQAAQSMLAQANQAPQGVLQLLR